MNDALMASADYFSYFHSNATVRLRTSFKHRRSLHRIVMIKHGIITRNQFIILTMSRCKELVKVEGKQ